LPPRDDEEPDFPQPYTPPAPLGDWDTYSAGYSDGDFNAWVPEWFGDAMSEMGYEPADLVDHNFVIHCDGDIWWGEVDGEIVTPVFDGGNNSDLWDIYDWWNEYMDEPPERDIDYEADGGA
jgi:hypothetical protein